MLIEIPGPAVKVPGLVFCAGQTATGGIKQATVRQSFTTAMSMNTTDRRFIAHRPSKSQGSPRAIRIIIGQGRQVQCLPGRHERLRGNERGVYRFLAATDALEIVLTGGTAGERDCD